MEENKDITFVAKHYKKGLFAVEPALRRIKPTSRWWTRTRIAAASIAAIIMAATAAVVVHNGYFTHHTSGPELMEQHNLPASEIVRIIDFEDAPLPVVVEKIREVYGVDVSNLPENAEDYSLSLHYEGSATDLVETINDILDTDIRIEQ